MWLTDNLWGLRAAGTNPIQRGQVYAAHQRFTPDSQLGKGVTVEIFLKAVKADVIVRDIALCLWQVPSLSVVFVTQLEPASQIVICFLFAQPLVCKLLSVNQATNYTAAASRMEPFLPQGQFLELRV